MKNKYNMKFLIELIKRIFLMVDERIELVKNTVKTIITSNTNR